LNLKFSIENLCEIRLPNIEELLKAPDTERYDVKIEAVRLLLHNLDMKEQMKIIKLSITLCLQYSSNDLRFFSECSGFLVVSIESSET
jgi:hypothetical protein